ncbi:MAG: fatty acid cis/trans isomerase, partial [Zoogloeaceae bacterium]|nr:fatty acid cis/trans isomerase [Zoogloeaceae bacterium]
MSLPRPPHFRPLSLVSWLPLLLLAGCAAVAAVRLESVLGPQDPAAHDVRRWQDGQISYEREVQPILTRRCVVCHACYDAPCQLKLTAWEGVARGSTKSAVYGVSRLVEGVPTRLFEDADQASGWRQLGFHPVLNEWPTSGEGNRLSASVLHRMLELKTQNPGPRQGVLPGERFNFDINRELSCPNLAEFDGFAARHPEWGMPYALPAITRDEQSILNRWLAQGAPADSPPAPSAAERRQVGEWERFLNGDSLKERLMSRYLFEHLFLGHLHFDGEAEAHFFRLVRSATPPGEPVRRIATRRPHDDPGVPRVWYRLVPDLEVVVAKTHMPYRLDGARMARWRALFLGSDYTVERLPGYSAEEVANPFATYAAIPPGSRYRFMLDEAAFTIMGFIKGPVCRGQVALNVINDHFWVFFADPDNDKRDAAVDRFVGEQIPNLGLPAGWTSKAPSLVSWLDYSRREMQYLEERSRYLDKVFAKGHLKLDLNLIWDGGGQNPNAALTIFRHLDSATVLQGLAGDPPKTAWVFTYPLLERIHYLLVANFDVFGTVGHQLESRLYMDFLRMEAEFNFLAYLPKSQREATRDRWYREADQHEKDFVYGKHAWLNHDSDVHYRTQDPQRELFEMLKARLGRAAGQRHSLAAIPDPGLRAGLAQLARQRGRALSWLPESTVLRLELPDQAPVYATLLRNTGHLNVSEIFAEERRLAPDDHTLSVVPGIVGAYPNALYRVPAADLPLLTQTIAGLASEEDYRRLADRFAVRRTAPDFWAVSDDLHAAYAR